MLWEQLHSYSVFPLRKFYTELMFLLASMGILRLVKKVLNELQSL